MDKTRLIRSILSMTLALLMIIAPVFSSASAAITLSVEDKAIATESENSDKADSGSAVDKSDNDAATESDSDKNATDKSSQESGSKDTAKAESESSEGGQSSNETASDDTAKAKKTKYEFIDEEEGLKVTAKLSDASAIPADAELIATPVTPDSKDYNYKAYMAALNKDADASYDESNTLLYDIAFIKDGTEIEPAAGTVSVTFEFLDSQLADEIGAEKASDISVIHLPLTDKVKDKYDTTADARKIDADDINVEAVTKEDNDLSVNLKKEKVEFEVEDFSVFAYTVDFEYEGYSFSIPGEGSIKLSEVFAELGIDKDIKDVESVTFSDTSLLEVKKSLLGSDWTLKSLKSFSTEEILTVTIKGSEVITINVTDPPEIPDGMVQLTTTNGWNTPVTVSFVDENGNALTDNAFTNGSNNGHYYLLAIFTDVNNGDYSAKLDPFVGMMELDNAANATVSIGRTDSQNLNFYSFKYASNQSYPNDKHLGDQSGTAEGSSKLNLAIVTANGGSSQTLDINNVASWIKDGGGNLSQLNVIPAESVLDSGYTIQSIDVDDTADTVSVKLYMAKYTVNVQFKDKDDNNVKPALGTYYIRSKVEDTNYAFEQVQLDDNGQQTAAFGSFAGRYSSNKVIYSSDEEVTTSIVTSDSDYDSAGITDGSVITVNGKTYAATFTGVEDGINIVFKEVEPYRYTIRESSDNTISLDNDFKENWYLVSTLTKSDGSKFYYVSDKLNLNEADVISGEIPVFYNDLYDLANVKLKDTGSGANNIKSVYTDGDTVETLLVQLPNAVDENNGSYNDVINASSKTTYSNDSVLNKYSVDATDEDGQATITLTKLSDLKLVTAFYDDAEKTTPSATVPSDYHLLIKMVRDGNTYYALQAVNSTANPSPQSNSITFYQYTEQYGAGSIGTIPYYYSGNGTETISTQVVTGASSLTADLIQHKVTDAVFYNENTIGGKQSSDLTKDLYSTSSEIKDDEGINVMTTTFIKQKDDGVDHDLNVSFYKAHKSDVSEAELNPSPDNLKADEKYFFCVRLYNNGKLVAYKIVAASEDDIAAANGNGTFTHTIKSNETFQLVDDEGVDIANGSLHYDPTVYTSKVRFYKVTNSWDNIPTNLSDVSDKGTDTFEGYDFWFNEYDEEKSDNAITKTKTNLGLYCAYNKKYQVQIVVDDGTPSETDKIGLLVKVTHMTTNTDAYENNDIAQSADFREETTEDGTTTITYLIEDQTTTETTYHWTTRGTDTNKITGNETFSLLLNQNNKAVQEGYPVKIGSDYYKITYDTGSEEGKNIVYDDTDKVTTITHFVHLTKVEEYDTAVTPHAIIGEAAEYGIIANRYEQSGHTETNYAVNELYDTANNSINGSGSNDIPFYIGKIDSYPLWLETNKNNLYVYMTQADIDDNIHNEMKARMEKNPDQYNLIPTDQKDINDYVNGLIKYGQEQSAAYAQKTTIKPSKPASEKETLDTTSFPDNITIYVDCENILDEMATTGWEIKKLPGQSIVFNMPGTGTVNIGKMVANIYDPDDTTKLLRSVSTQTSDFANSDGTSDAAKTWNADIMQHITFNVYEADEVNLKTAGGLILAPNASTVNQQDGAGTILTKGTVKSKAEWHFYNQERSFSGKARLEVTKNFTGRTWGDADKFSFILASKGKMVNGQLDENASVPMPANDGEKVEIGKPSSGSSNTEKFGTINYTEAGVYVYTIREDIPADEVKIAGVTYDSSEYTAIVTVTKDESTDKLSETIEYKKNDSTVDTATFTNAYQEDKGTLKVNKAVSGAPGTASGKEYKFTVKVKDSNPVQYVQENGNLGEGSHEFTVKAGSTTTISNIPVGNYEVVEDTNDAAINGYSLNATGGGAVSVEKNSEASSTLTNEYTKEEQDATGSIQLKATKELTGRDWTDSDSFGFTLAADENNPEGATLPTTVTKNVTKNTKTVEFDAITFTKAGEYKFTITETVPTGAVGNKLNGIIYDGTAKEITVTVTDKGDGTLECTANPADKTVTASNTYAATGEGEIKVKKTFTGREWKTNDKFTFTISAAEGTPMPANTSIEIGKPESGTENTVSFGTIPFTQAGEYTYTVKETKGSLGGVTYDENEHTVTIKVVDDGNGHLVADTGSALVKTEEFSNTYAASGKGEVKVQKVLEGRDWTDTDEFTFTIEAATDSETGTPVPSPNSITIKNTDADHTKSFGEMNFTKAGTYKYVVKETKGNIAGITYDEAAHIVTIKVVDDGAGHLVADTGSNLVQTTQVTNTYGVSGKGEIKVQKVLNGRDWTNNDEFTFTLSKASDTEEGTPEPSTKSITIKKSDAGQIKSFGEIAFTKAGTYKYVVKETKGSLGGVSYDETDHNVTIKVVDDGNGNLIADQSSSLIQTETITNSYAANGSIQLKAKKGFSGRDWTDSDSFEFTLAADDSNPEGATLPTTVTKNATKNTQEVEFEAITFTKPGTYKFTITETVPTGAVDNKLNGITYDGDAKEITVTVTDKGDGTLECTADPVDKTVTASNTYAATGEGEIKVKKTFTGREWKTTDKFIFTISAAEGTPMPANTSIEIGKPESGTENTVSFGTIPFTQAGEYTYTVKETKGSLGGVNYDETERTVTIKVKDDGNGHLVADTDSALVKTEEFSNTYAASGKGEVKVQKVLEGRDWKDNDEFTFTISKASDSETETPMPSDTSITIKKTDSDHTKSFGEISFTKAGTYKYVVKETKGSISGITYDEAEHIVTIKVVDDGAGHLVADTDSALVQTTKVTNTYGASGKGEVKVQKVLSGREWTNDDEFTFTLEAAEGTPEPSTKSITIKKSDAGQIKSFGEISFEKAGTYTYTVKETKGTLGGVTYDEKAHTVTIKVVDDGQGNLVADQSSSLIKTETITNTYAAEGEGEIKVKKTFTGREWKTDDKFTFTITGESAPTGVTTIPMPANTSIEIGKPANGGEENTVSFGTINFTKPGTYTYTVKETKGTLGGVTYDETEHTVTIKVKDNGDGTLVADTDSELIQTEEFSNTYAAAGEGEIKVKKTFTGREWKTDDVFTFTLTGKSAPTGVTTVPMPANTSIEIGKPADDADNNTVSFGTINFTKPGTYTYTVKETKGSLGGVTYEEREHTVTIKVKDNGDGTLVADTDSALIQTEEFTNTYDAKGSIGLTGTKAFEHGDFADETFTFSVYKKSDFEDASSKLLGLKKVDMNELADDEELQSKKIASATTAGATVDKDGKVGFSFKTAEGKDLEYLLSDLTKKTDDGYATDTFEYVVVEDIPKTAVKKIVGEETFYYDSEKDIKYDATAYPLTITVTDNGSGTLEVSVSENKTEFEFTNAKVYTQLSLTKSIDKFIGEDTDDEYVDATLVFELKYDDPVTGEKDKTRSVSVKFTKDDPLTKTVTVDKIPIDATVTVKEVYSSNYKPGASATPVKSKDENGYPIWTVTLENTQLTTTTGSGIINDVKKADGKYQWEVKGSDSSQDSKKDDGEGTKEPTE